MHQSTVVVVARGLQTLANGYVLEQWKPEGILDKAPDLFSRGSVVVSFNPLCSSARRGLRYI